MRRVAHAIDSPPLPLRLVPYSLPCRLPLSHPPLPLLARSLPLWHARARRLSCVRVVPPLQSMDSPPALELRARKPQGGGHDAPISALCHNASRGLVCSGAQDGTVCVWELASCEARGIPPLRLLGRLAGTSPCGAIVSLATLVPYPGATPRVIAGGASGVVYEWTLRGGAVCRALERGACLRHSDRIRQHGRRGWPSRALKSGVGHSRHSRAALPRTHSHPVGCPRPPPDPFPPPPTTPPLCPNRHRRSTVRLGPLHSRRARARHVSLGGLRRWVPSAMALGPRDTDRHECGGVACGGAG